MPRGDNPNSRANLAKAHGGKGNFSSETARRANKKSQEAKKDYKSFKECFNDMMTPEMRKKLFDTMYRKAQAGNIKAFEVMRDTMGEKPVEKVEQMNANIEIDFSDIEEGEKEE